MLAPILGDIAELIKVLIEAILPIFVSLFEALAPIILQVVEALLPLLEILLPLLTMMIESFIGPALQFFAEMLGTLITALSELTLFGLAPSLEAFGAYDGGIRETMFKIRQNVAETMNGMIDFLEQGTNGVIDSINQLLESARQLPGIAGAIARKINNLPPIELKRIEVPGLYDDMTFGEVDVTGVRDIADRFLQARPGESATDEANRRMGTLTMNQDFNQAQALATLVDRFGFKAMADGGIVQRPIVGMIGEAGPEAVIPLNKAGSLGSTVNITVNAGMGTNGARVGEEIVTAIKRYERSSGPVFARA
jgi:hypothetical protein